MEDIGKRAAEFVFAKAAEEDITLQKFCKRMHIYDTTVYAWADGKQHPSAKKLRDLALLGADANYILTGEKRK